MINRYKVGHIIKLNANSIPTPVGYVSFENPLAQIVKVEYYAYNHSSPSDSNRQFYTRLFLIADGNTKFILDDGYHNFENYIETVFTAESSAELLYG